MHRFPFSEDWIHPLGAVAVHYRTTAWLSTSSLSIPKVLGPAPPFDPNCLAAEATNGAAGPDGWPRAPRQRFEQVQPCVWATLPATSA